MEQKIKDLGFVRTGAEENNIYFDKRNKKIIVTMCGLCFSKGWDCCQGTGKDIPLRKLQTTKDVKFNIKNYFSLDANDSPYIPCGTKCPNLGKKCCKLPIQNRPLPCNIFPFVVCGNFLAVDFGMCPAVSQHSLKHLQAVGKELLEHLLATYTKEELADVSYPQADGMINLGLYF